MHYIYIIINSINDKVYVGQSVNPESRFRTHRHLLNNSKHSNPHLQNSWLKYKEKAFEFYILKECLDQEVTNYDEEFYINWFKKLNLCFNYKSGGNNGHPSQETIEKIRLANTGRKHSQSYKDACRNRMLGKKATDETKLKMSISQLQRPKQSQETINKRRKSLIGNKYNLGKKRSESLLGKKRQPVGPRKTSNKYTAFNETKFLSEWLSDDRCLLKRTAINNRLKEGWSFEEAISVPFRKKRI